MADNFPLLKHNPSAQRPEVLEATTVQREPLIADLVDAALDVDGGLRHHLLVGPRGSGKSHVTTLVAHRIRQVRSDDIVLVALVEDPWAIRNYGKLVAAIAAGVAEAEESADLAAEAARLRAVASADGSEGEQVLRDAIGDRRLVLLVENLGDIFQRIGDPGQQSLRALAENWRQMLILATSPQLFEGVSEHPQPFYGFFRITHLDELSLESAVELLRKVAQLRGDDDLLRFLASDVALARLRAVEALAGGHPRVWLLLAGCVSVEAIDDLVPLFLEVLDDLTPYYQDRLRELGHQQQEIVMLLSELGGALTNRELAEHSGLSQNMVASRLSELATKGYVRKATLPEPLAAGDQRLTHWELREPLMRLCLDVKQSRGKPLRVIVEFLRSWYGARLLDEIARLPPTASLAMHYASEAFRGIVDSISDQELLDGSPAEIVRRAEIGLQITPGRMELALAKAEGLIQAGRQDEADEVMAHAKSEVDRCILGIRLAIAPDGAPRPGLASALDRLADVLPEPPARREAWMILAMGHMLSGNDDGAASAYQQLASAAPDDAEVRMHLAHFLRGLGRVQEALVAAREAVELGAGAPADKLMAALLMKAGDPDRALEFAVRAVNADPDDGFAQLQLGTVHFARGHADLAVVAARRAITIDPGNIAYALMAGSALLATGDVAEALPLLERASVALPDQPELRDLLGLAFLNTGRVQEALGPLREAAERLPHTAEDICLYGTALRAAGRLNEAVEAFERAVVVAPEDTVAWRQMASALDALGHPAEAEDAVRKAMSLEPDDWSVGLYANLVRRRGHGEEADRLLIETLEQHPTWAGVRNDLANSLVARGEFQAAETHARQAGEDRNADDTIPLFTYAEVAMARRDVEGAMSRFEAALSAWSETEEDEPGDATWLCTILWSRFDADARRDQAVAQLVELYGAHGVLPVLGAGLTGSISLWVGDDVAQAAAESWLDTWRAGAQGYEELDVALAVVEAAVRWKRDGDRAHLLALPAEQREVLTSILLGDKAG